MRNDEPLISVIVPVCNGQDYLENCIQSIEGQTYGNLEVIIVNNGSTDKTGNVCDRLQADHDNVRILTLDEKGVSSARNRGIEAARGELIAFVDADDRICPDMLKRLYNCMVDMDCDIAGCSFFMWGSEEEWKQGVVQETASGERAAEQTYVYDAGGYLKDAVLCGNSRCWSKLYRREIFDRVHFPEELTIGEDLLFLVRTLPFLDRIAETDYRGYGYYQNPVGAMNMEFKPGYMDQITCWQLAREDILRMNPELDAQVTALYMMGIMLTAGKLAMLSAAERHGHKQYIQVCHRRLREAVRISGAYGRLSAGYQIKTILFLLCPNLYLFLYNRKKLAQ